MCHAVPDSCVERCVLFAEPANYGKFKVKTT